MKKPEQLLQDLQHELEAGKELIKDKDCERKEAKSKLKKKNAKRSLKLIRKAVKAIEDHEEIVTARLRK
jgi:hypothetical protein